MLRAAERPDGVRRGGIAEGPHLDDAAPAPGGEIAVVRTERQRGYVPVRSFQGHHEVPGPTAVDLYDAIVVRHGQFGAVRAKGGAEGGVEGGVLPEDAIPVLRRPNFRGHTRRIGDAQTVRADRQAAATG